jgi:predicted peptidase
VSLPRDIRSAAISSSTKTPAELTLAARYRSPAGESLPYRLYLPSAPAAGRKLPLLLCLHGAGSRGEDNLAQLNTGFLTYLRYCRAQMPAILLGPQCPEGKRWVDTDWSAPRHTMPDTPTPFLRMALELVDELCRQHPVDPSRLYLSGVSMGAYGVWDVLQRRPRDFAAAVAVCGGGDAARATTISQVPIWVFHGDQDTAVPVCRSREMVAALRALGAPVRYTEYAGMGHTAWDQTFANPEVPAWLFSQRRASAEPGRSRNAPCAAGSHPFPGTPAQRSARLALRN